MLGYVEQCQILNLKLCVAMLRSGVGNLLLLPGQNQAQKLAADHK